MKGDSRKGTQLTSKHDLGDNSTQVSNKQGPVSPKVERLETDKDEGKYE